MVDNCNTRTEKNKGVGSCDKNVVEIMGREEREDGRGIDRGNKGDMGNRDQKFV